jgi:hypothetical protein
MIGPRPVAVARYLIAITVMVLPGDTRDRYREEFRTELSELGGAAQIAEAASLLRGAFALRQALEEREMDKIGIPKTDWRCHLGRHRYVRKVDDNPEVRGQSVLECTRCGKHEDGPPDSSGAAGLRAAGLNGVYGAGG